MTATLDVNWPAGLDVIARRAAQPGGWSANEIRAELRELGFSRFTSGSLFKQAEASGVIRQIGVERSTDGPTHGAYVRRWIGCEQRGGLDTLIPRRETVTVPVHRDRGRFTSSQPGFTDVPLFDVTGATS